MVETGRVSLEPGFDCLYRCVASALALTGSSRARQPDNPTDFTAACQSGQDAHEKIVPLALANHEISAVNRVLRTKPGLLIRNPIAVDRHTASPNQPRRLAFRTHHGI